jgi:teichuronic acid biosynthesis glycosyltransferase TuaH
MNDILYISIENWFPVWRRNQNVVSRLARRHPDSKILYCNLPIDLSYQLRQGKIGTVLKQWKPVAPEPLADLPNVFLFSPVKLLPNTLTAGRLTNYAMARAQIRKAAKQVGLRNPLLYINPYFAAHMAGRMGESAIIYDVGDDWSAMDDITDRMRQQVLQEDTSLAHDADAVIVVSENLAAMRRKILDEVHLIPNGVNVAAYHGVAEHTMDRHPITREWKSPVLGYTGTLHSDRIDADVLLAVARAFPEATIALVGPNHLTPVDMQKLQNEPNVKFAGTVDFPQVPSVMAAFDVGIVPYHVNGFTESQDPLKLYEFLAAGLPVVATPTSGFRDFPGLVHTARGADEFVNGIRAALAEGPEMIDRRRRAVAPFNWDARVDEIETVINNCLTRRRDAVDQKQVSVN